MLTSITQTLTASAFSTAFSNHCINHIAFSTKPGWFTGSVRMERFNGQCGASLEHNSTTSIL